MTGVVAFGDLLDLSRRHLDRAAGIGDPRGGDRDLPDIVVGMHRLAIVLDGYLGDAAGWLTAQPNSHVFASSPWVAAIVRARQAAAQAAWCLRPATSAQRPAGGSSERGLLVRDAARTLAAGRDLLFSHVTTAPNGQRIYGSDWAPDIASLRFCRAVAAEVGELARQAAAFGASLVTVPARGREETSDTRQAMSSACRHLRAVYAVTAAAHEQEPVLAEDRELLGAVPLNIAPSRRVPDGPETIAELCQGVLVAASRLRSSVRHAARRAPWLPEVNADTLRHAASASMAAQHNCGLILHVLASKSAFAGDGGDTARLEAAADAADRSRDAWLTVARGLKLIVSDMRGYLSAEVADINDLTLWTGRLAYADPSWNLASGPHHESRSAGQLAATPREAGGVIAAVHHAVDALDQLADVHQQHARAAAQQRRLLVPTRSLPDVYDVPRPYSAAPPDRTTLILSVYRDARQASSQARTAVAEAARAAKAPSRVLALVKGARQHDQSRDGAERQAGTEGVMYQPLGLAGPAERSLRELGAADPGLVRRAITIDQAVKQLLIDAATGNRSRQASTEDVGNLAEALRQPEEPQPGASRVPGSQPEREPGD